MYSRYGYTLLWSVQPLPLLSFTLLPPNPHFSTAFNTHPYILYLHIMFHNIVDALSSLFLSLLPQVPQSTSTVTNMFYI
jgi:hypothetical protein